MQILCFSRNQEEDWEMCYLPSKLVLEMQANMAWCWDGRS
jgi:hypothetical protein